MREVFAFVTAGAQLRVGPHCGVLRKRRARDGSRRSSPPARRGGRGDAAGLPHGAPRLRRAACLQPHQLARRQHASQWLTSDGAHHNHIRRCTGQRGGCTVCSVKHVSAVFIVKHVSAVFIVKHVNSSYA